MNAALSFLSALLFGAGLAVSGMMDTAKVQNFLDFTGQWDPSLAFVMAAALAVTATGYALLRRMRTTVYGAPLSWPTRSDIDGRLIAGAALFGMGWGAAGYCPGPALASLASLALGQRDAAIFVFAMALGMALAQRMWGTPEAHRVG